MELKQDTWIWVIVQDPGENEMFLGQYDEINDVSFIPAFLERQDVLGEILNTALHNGSG